MAIATAVEFCQTIELLGKVWVAQDLLEGLAVIDREEFPSDLAGEADRLEQVASKFEFRFGGLGPLLCLAQFDKVAVPNFCIAAEFVVQALIDERSVFFLVAQELIDAEALGSRLIGVRNDLFGPFVKRLGAFLSFGRARRAFDRVLGAIDRLAYQGFPQAFLDPFCIFLREFEPHPLAPKFFGDTKGRAAAAKRVKDQVLRIARSPNDTGEQLLGHLATVEPLAFLEGSRNAAKVPCVMARAEALRSILWTGDPGVVRETSVGVCPRIGIHQLPCRLNSDLRIEAIEGESVWILDEME